MLQRQIMFKQLQEMQRRQQLQELSDARNQNYANQLSALKQASGGQFPNPVNGAPIHDSSQMFMFSNLQMMQHGGSGVVQGLPNRLEILQGQIHPVAPEGLSEQQFDISSYGTAADKNLNHYFHLQGPPNLSANLFAKNNNRPLEMPVIQPSVFSSSFLSQRSNFSSEQIITQDGSFLPNQVVQEKNLFGQVPIQNFDNEILSGSYSSRGITAQMNASLVESVRQVDAGSHGLSSPRVSKNDPPQPAASLDPLEQKILYNTDDNSCELSFSRTTKVGIGGFESTIDNASDMDAFPSVQSGSWSALMQSAVAETSSSDTGLQEEWSGLSFQNPEPSTENQLSNAFSVEQTQNNWVDRNLQNLSSARSKPENFDQNTNANYNFPGFEQSHLYLKQKEEFLSDFSHVSTHLSPGNTSQLADYNSKRTQHLIEGNRLIQTSSPLQSIWPGQPKEPQKIAAHQPTFIEGGTDNHLRNNFSGQELRGTSWLQGSTSHNVAGDNQKPFDKSQLNFQRYLMEPEKNAPRNNVEVMPAFLNASSDHGRNVDGQSEIMLELLNEDDISNDHVPGMQLNSQVLTPSELPPTEIAGASIAKSCKISKGSRGFGFRPGPVDPQSPQSHLFFPALSMGLSSTTSLSSYNVNDYNENQCTAPPQMAAKFSAGSPCFAAAYHDNSQLKITRSSGPEFRVMENFPTNQNMVNPVVSVRGAFPMDPSCPWPDLTTQQSTSSPIPYKFSSSSSRPSDSASSSVETGSGAPKEQPSPNSIRHEYTVEEFGACSGKLDSDVRLAKGSPLPSGVHNINRTVISRKHEQDSLRKHDSEVDVAASGSLMSLTHQQPSKQAEWRDIKTPSFLARNIGDLGHSLSQNFALVHQDHLQRISETDTGKKLPVNYDGAHYQRASTRELFLSGQMSGITNKTPTKVDALTQVAASSSGDSRAWNFSKDSLEDWSNKASSTTYLQNIHQNRSISSSEASNVTYQSPISLQMSPSWFKHYRTLKNGQMLQMYNPRALSTATQPFSGTTPENLLDSSLIMQVNPATTSQGSSLWPAMATTLMASKHASPPNFLPSDSSQNLAVPLPKKRKMVSFDMVPWNKEVNHEALSLQNISMAELEWAQALNRRQEEVKNEAEIFEEGLLPGARAKRRLICTTQLMQQLFPPPPAVIVCTDATSNSDGVAYFTARLVLRDACSFSRLLLSYTNDEPSDKLMTSTRRKAHDFSKVLEGLIAEVKKLEDNFSRMEKSLSIVDLKVANQDLEKFSIINRFAKFHIKPHPSTVDPALSSGASTLPIINLQRYVMAIPMPGIVPEGTDCLSL